MYLHTSTFQSGCQINPKGWLIDTPLATIWHPKWKIQISIYYVYTSCIWFYMYVICIGEYKRSEISSTCQFTYTISHLRECPTNMCNYVMSNICLCKTPLNYHLWRLSYLKQTIWRFLPISRKLSTTCIVEFRVNGWHSKQPSKNPGHTFHHTGCLLGILIMVLWNHP